MIKITGASLVAVNQSNEFFGDRTARYRNVQNLSVNGFLADAKQRFANPVFQNLDSVSGVVSGRVNQLVADISSTNAVEEPIYINDIFFGNGKIVSIDFPNSPSTKEGDIFLGSFNATFEFYNDGDSASVSTAFDGLTIPTGRLLDNFSERFDVSLDSSNNYKFTHEVEARYLSGVNVDPFDCAKTLASNIYNQTLTTYNALIPGFYGNYDSAGKRTYKEFYDAVNGDARFSQDFTLYASGTSAGTFTSNVTHSFNFSEDGKISVTEDGEILGRANNRNQMVTNAINGVNTELAGSFARCSDVYDSYKSLLVDGTYSESLNNSRMDTSKSVDYNAGTASYSVSYTDDLGFVSASKMVTRDISINKDKNIVKATEDGEVTLINKKGNLSLTSYLSNIPSRSSSKSRCQTVYSKNGYTRSLKNESQDYNLDGIQGENESSPKGGKKIGYSYSFTDDPEVFDAGTFAKLQVKTNDKMPIVNTQPISVPNIGHVMQTLDQASLASRNVSAVGLIRRVAGVDTFNNIPSYKTTVISARNTMLTQVLSKGLSIFQDNTKLKPLDSNEIYVKSLSFDFTSSREMNMTSAIEFPVQRFDSASDRRMAIGT